jgi:hypothetical protein
VASLLEVALTVRVRFGAVHWSTKYRDDCRAILHKSPATSGAPLPMKIVKDRKDGRFLLLEYSSPKKADELVQTWMVYRPPEYGSVTAVKVD